MGALYQDGGQNSTRGAGNLAGEPAFMRASAYALAKTVRPDWDVEIATDIELTYYVHSKSMYW